MFHTIWISDADIGFIWTNSRGWEMWLELVGSDQVGRKARVRCVGGLIGCASTVFGCCPDGETVATDWSYVGCPGRMTLHHCMPSVRPSVSSYLRQSTVIPTADADATATQLSSCVASASAVCTEFATSSWRLPTDSVANLETEHSGLTTWILIEYWSPFSTMTSLCRHLSSTAQEIVNWVTTADGCVRTADTSQLDFTVGNFVQTRRNCRQL